MLGVSSRPARAATGFRHEALVYAGEDQFVRTIGSFIVEGLTEHEPTMVVVSAPKIDRLRRSLGPDSAHVRFADMESVGANPARIIAAWKDFVDDHGPDRPLRGVGEPIHPARTEPELVECHLHESLLNVAFGDGPSLHLVCPYDETRLDAEVIHFARHTHPVVRGAVDDTGDHYAGRATANEILRRPLPRPPVEPEELRFSAGPLHDFRRFVAQQAMVGGLSGDRADDVVLAANEIASNSVLHGGGSGVVRTWSENETFLCEVRDRGRIDDPMVGRLRPTRERLDGRGVWMANQLCDLVQLRSFDNGTVVRLHMRTGSSAI